MSRYDPRGWGLAKRVIVALTALALGALCLVTVAEVGTTPSASFVTRSGTSLMLNAKAFRFSGANIPWGALDESGGALDYPSDYQVNTALATVNDMGGTVVRCHTCGISTGNPQSVEPSLGAFNQTALDHIDYFVAQAGKDGIRLDIPLVDAYNFYEGGYYIFTDWLGLSTPSNCPSTACASIFYTNPRAIAAYEAYISEILNHVNIYTGVANKNNPTIMSWETGNELSYGLGGAPEFTAWTSTISTYIKSIAPNQLVADGLDTLDPGVLKLPNVDIEDQHAYPMETSWLSMEASQTAAAGKVLIIGEYAWNSATGVSPAVGLAPFLSAIQSTPEVSGDLYWDLLPSNNDWGFEQDFDGFTMHYPGDTSDVAGNGISPPVTAASSDAPLVALLVSHAYAMSGIAPAYAVPAAPVITNVERESDPAVGTGNIVEWQNVAGAVSYEVQRSTVGATGPWTVAGSVPAGNQTPWLDSGAPAGPNVWYQVTAVNAGGVDGPASAVYQMNTLTLDDNAVGFSHTINQTGGVAIATSTPAVFGGYTSRINYSAGEPYAYIVWSAPGLIQSVEAVAFYSVLPASFQIQVSTDGQNWVNVPAGDLQAQELTVGAGDQSEYIYTIDGLQSLVPGAKYVALQRSSDSAGTAELGEMRITYAPSS